MVFLREPLVQGHANLFEIGFRSGILLNFIYLSKTLEELDKFLSIDTFNLQSPIGLELHPTFLTEPKHVLIGFVNLRSLSLLKFDSAPLKLVEEHLNKHFFRVIGIDASKIETVDLLASLTFNGLSLSRFRCSSCW